MKSFVSLLVLVIVSIVTYALLGAFIGGVFKLEYIVVVTHPIFSFLGGVLSCVIGWEALEAVDNSDWSKQ